MIDSNLLQQLVGRPVPLSGYKGLRVGNDLSLQYETSDSDPIDGSNKLLRNLSPFIIQVEPPLAFGEDGGFINKNKKAGEISTYQNATGGSAAGYKSSRKALSESNINKIPGSLGAKEFIVKNSCGANSQKTSTGPGDSQGKTAVKLGQPAIADVYAASDIATQLSAILNTPPLIFLINPTNLNIKYGKIQQFQDRTRTNYVFHSWGEEQPVLSIEAVCGGFYYGKNGVQIPSKVHSAAWQNLVTVFQFYKNNGYIYDTIGKSNANYFVGALSIHYDQWVYYGNMDSFTYSLTPEVTNGSVKFSMQFNVTAMQDNGSQGLIVRPMVSPIPSAADPRYDEGRVKSTGNIATASWGGHSRTVGDADPVQRRGSAFGVKR